MKNIITWILLFWILISQMSASFMYQEIDPICSITGTTHTSFPWEISDTSSWSMPKAYDGECDETPDLSNDEKSRIFIIMKEFFEKKDLTWPVYGWNQENSYGGNDSLNPDGQDYVNDKLFPAIISYINRERAKSSPNTKNIAILNYAAKTVGYDYFISQP